MKYLSKKAHFRNCFLIVIASSCLASCSSQSGNDPSRDPELAERGRKLQTELVLGKLMASELAGTFGVAEIKNPGMRTYLNTLAQAMARKAGRPEISYRVEILADAKANAYATPGGYVFVTSGLLDLVRSEEELAGVLAHEIGHVNEKHVLSKVLKSDDTAVGTLARVAGGGRATMGGSVNQAAQLGMAMLLDTGYGPELELEADRFAAELVTSVGYSPMPYYNLLLRMSALKGESKVSKTHPPFPARLASLKKFFIDEKFWNLVSPVAPSPVIGTRFEENRRSM